MAGRVHRREAAYRRRIALLVAYGAIKGLPPALSRILGATELEPLGVAAGSLIAGAAMLGGRWEAPSRRHLAALPLHAAVGSAAPLVLLLVAAAEIPAGTPSLLLASQGLPVFPLTALLGVETRSLVRLLGLLLGFGGIVLALASPGWGVAGGVAASTLAVALPVPMGRARGTVVRATMPPAGSASRPAHAAIAPAFATAGVSASALAVGTLPPVDAPMGTDGLLILALGAVGGR